MNETHFATNFDKLSSVFIENSKNVVVGNVITADTIHIGDKYYYTVNGEEIRPTLRFLTKNPFMTKIFLGREDDLKEG